MNDLCTCTLIHICWLSRSLFVPTFASISKISISMKAKDASACKSTNCIRTCGIVRACSHEKTFVHICMFQVMHMLIREEVIGWMCSLVWIVTSWHAHEHFLYTFTNKWQCTVCMCAIYCMCVWCTCSVFVCVLTVPAVQFVVRSREWQKQLPELQSRTHPGGQAMIDTEQSAPAFVAVCESGTTQNTHARTHAYTQQQTHTYPAWATSAGVYRSAISIHTTLVASCKFYAYMIVSEVNEHITSHITRTHAYAHKHTTVKQKIPYITAHTHTQSRSHMHTHPHHTRNANTNTSPTW